MRYIDAEKLKAEIERLKIENNNIRCTANESYCVGYDDAFGDLFSIIDSLQQEQPSEDLEEAADKYEQDYFTDATLGEAFIAGAEWQKEKMIKEMFAEQGTTQEEYLDKSMAQVREMYKKLGITMAKEEKK